MARYRISAPESAHNGEVGGLMFAKGVYEGEVPDQVLRYFEAQGYTLEQLEVDKPAASRRKSASDKPAGDGGDSSDGGESK